MVHLVVRFMLICSQRQGGKWRTKLDKLQEVDGYRQKQNKRKKFLIFPLGETLLSLNVALVPLNYKHINQLAYITQHYHAFDAPSA